MVGLSARALAAAARSAGYRPLAADLFNDLDLQEIAEASVRIDGDLERGVERGPLINALEGLAADRDPIGIIYGAGFEDRADLLDRLAERWEVLGNSAAAVARAKDPAALARICGQLPIPHPRWSSHPEAPDWLRKRRGGAGGAHVLSGGPGPISPDRETYWQERVPGEPVSALVLSSGSEAAVLGFSQQWADPTAGAPFRYGGAVRPAALPAAIESALEQAARSVVERLGLVGLNGVDFLVDSENWYMIEVNPRPGTTLDIFEPEGGLFRLHLDACRGRIPAALPPFTGAAAAAIVYAREPIERVPEFAWPDWAADRQPAGTRVEGGAPICTVLARAEDAGEARRIVGERADAIRAALRTRRGDA